MSMNSTSFAIFGFHNSLRSFSYIRASLYFMRALPRIWYVNILQKETGLIPTGDTVMLSSWGRRRVDRRNVLSCIRDERPIPSPTTVKRGRHRSRTIISQCLIIFPSTEPYLRLSLVEPCPRSIASDPPVARRIG